MLKKVLILIVFVIVAFVVGVFLQPSEFRITRSAVIPAPVAVVFEYVNDLHKWQEWSPWARLDPKAKATFEGPIAGTGATFHWAGNNQVGEGSMIVTQSTPNEYVRFNLEFLKPFKANNTTEFTFKPEGDQTVVTWTMFGKNDFLGKAMSLVMNCDKMVGGQFEQGFAHLKSVVESTTK